MIECVPQREAVVLHEPQSRTIKVEMQSNFIVMRTVLLASIKSRFLMKGPAGARSNQETQAVVLQSPTFSRCGSEDGRDHAGQIHRRAQRSRPTRFSVPSDWPLRVLCVEKRAEIACPSTSSGP
jgi:hypothetical protein